MTTTDKYTRRKHTGLPGNGGRFATPEHEEAEGVFLEIPEPELRPEAERAYQEDLRDIEELKAGHKPTLSGKIWSLPDWEVAKRHPEWVQAYASESVFRYLNRSERLNPQLREDLENETLAEFYDYASKNKVNNPGNLIGHMARVTVGKNRGDGSRDHTSDRYARQILADHIHAFTQKNSREPSSSELKELAANIRENWESERIGYSTSTRPPRAGFAEQDSAPLSLDVMTDGGLSGELGDHISLADIRGDRQAENERLREVTRGINEANVMAGKFYLSARAKFAEQKGREMTAAEEDELAKIAIRKWPRNAEFQPTHDFHRRSASFYEPPVRDWSERVFEVAADPERGGKRLARVMVWNAISETFGCPQVQVGCMTKSRCERIRKTVRGHGVMQTITDWEDGWETKETAALFAPWPGISEAEKSEIVSTFRANARHAEGLWDSAVSIANPSFAERIIG